jgi:molybdopterin-biosynthesis enzyme MoeA-like protein
MNFYVVIIGTEILNARRQDKHFAFVQKELSRYGHEIFASFILKDDKKLIARTYKMIKEDPEAVMFSFGGIGSTPDDLTREIASEVFRSSKPVVHHKFLQDILERFGKEAYPHRIHMAELPSGAQLLHNPVNNMSGFSLDDRFFFVPGFPSMAHPMIRNVIQKYFSKKKEKYRCTLLADTSENTLIETMQKLPDSIELSSLPMFVDDKPKVELSLSGENKEELQEHFQNFQAVLQAKNINYKLI